MNSSINFRWAMVIEFVSFELFHTEIIVFIQECTIIVMPTWVGNFPN